MAIIKELINNHHHIDILSKKCLSDRKFGNLLGDYQALVAIPDMHMFIHGSPQDCFQYGSKAMLGFLEQLRELKYEYDYQGKKLAVVQLGDLYELRYPHPVTGNKVTDLDIKKSHPVYTRILNLLEELQTTFIFGNHDYEMSRRSNFCSGKTIGQVYLEHGYRGDRWYHFSNPETLIWSPSMKVYSKLRRWEAKLNNIRKKIQLLDEGRQAVIGIKAGDKIRASVGSTGNYPKGQLAYYTGKLIDRIENSAPIKAVITAHSHTPLIHHNAQNDLLYIDAGAWTEGRSDFAVLTNDEISLCRYRRESARIMVPVSRSAARPQLAF